MDITLQFKPAFESLTKNQLLELLFAAKNNLRYDVVVSSDVARTKTNGCIFFKLRDPSIDVLPSHYYSHKFVCVAPYNTDTLLLINIPKTMLEKVIKVGNNFSL